jgi:hypothetical protein
MRAKDVHSPRDHWRLVQVLYDGGDDGFSIMMGYWDDEPVLVGRWNGPAGGKGMPLSSGYPVPLVFPSFMWDAILSLDVFSDQKIAFARMFLYPAKAAE